MWSIMKYKSIVTSSNMNRELHKRRISSIRSSHFYCCCYPYSRLSLDPFFIIMSFIIMEITIFITYTCWWYIIKPINKILVFYERFFYTNKKTLWLARLDHIFIQVSTMVFITYYTSRRLQESFLDYMDVNDRTPIGIYADSRINYVT